MLPKQLVVFKQGDNMMIGYDYNYETGEGKYLCHVSSGGTIYRQGAEIDVVMDDDSIQPMGLSWEVNLYEELTKAMERF